MKTAKKNQINVECKNDAIDKKTEFLIETIQKTIKHIDNMKKINIITTNDTSCYINSLLELNEKLKLDDENVENRINLLQKITNELSTIFKLFGTESLEDMLLVCCGTINNSGDVNKLNVLLKYFHPTSYKMCQKKEDNLINHLDCNDVEITNENFHLNIHGIKILYNNLNSKKSLIITGILDNVVIDLIRNDFITNKYYNVLLNIPTSQEELFHKYLKSLNLKDFILNDATEIISKYYGYLSNINAIKNKAINDVVKEFMSSTLSIKRLTIIQLLISLDYDSNHLAYILFDLLPNEVNNMLDNTEQMIIFESLSWQMKEHFKDEIINVKSNIMELINSETRKIPLENQICLMKVPDSVKEKAFQKLKEIKSKDESGSGKARNYLEGLLKIPFGIYKKEPIMLVVNDIKKKYNEMMNTDLDLNSLEILTNLNKMIKTFENEDDKKNKLLLKNITKSINEVIMSNKLEIKPIKMNTVTNKERLNFIFDFLSMNKNNLINENIFKENNMLVQLNEIEQKYKEISNYVINVKKCLDNSVHGHENAKKQLETIICQWINGKQDGYCFGFEGPPGVGKTTLAKKGLSKCLLDDKQESRPFSMIQMGGNSGGSILKGHSYTYHGSTWGSIVQILIDKKCMNPIIFIDEVDKISNTEYGKEITNILTHLLDQTQNDCFQDKYFSGIELDLSKALFILSYNDVSMIDKVLLDRIHIIKFNSLTLKEKIEICNNYILPEIYDKMGLKGAISISNDVLKYLIEEYTIESGVRKLKELLFEIIGEINLDVLKNLFSFDEYPINITVNDIKTKYFKNKRSEIKFDRINEENKIGEINGLWANNNGKGGIVKIQTNWRPSNSFFELNLTGMQGSVMKESMHVASTLAWNMTSKKIQDEILNENNKCLKGLHIHCPDGSMPKDGPSAGTAITACIYSVINNLKIKSDIAITGEINLNGDVTMIGGLDLKILGGIKGGVKNFIYPKENEEEFNEFMDKFGKENTLNGIKFYSVERIEEVFELVFEK
jgi:ATP-dependent Lon protease